MTLHSPGNLHNAWPSSASSFSDGETTLHSNAGFSGADLTAGEWVGGPLWFGRERLKNAGFDWRGQEVLSKMLWVKPFTHPEWSAIQGRVTTQEEYDEYLGRVRRHGHWTGTQP
jgi:hypothetical protein